MLKNKQIFNTAARLAAAMLKICCFACLLAKKKETNIQHCGALSRGDVEDLLLCLLARSFACLLACLLKKTKLQHRHALRRGDVEELLLYLLACLLACLKKQIFNIAARLFATMLKNCCFACLIACLLACFALLCVASIRFALLLLCFRFASLRGGAPQEVMFW